MRPCGDAGSFPVQAPVGQKLHQPVDEDAYLVAEMTVRRVDDVERDRLDVPFGQELNEPACPEIVGITMKSLDDLVRSQPARPAAGAPVRR